jgi:hypothetical protein
VPIRAAAPSGESTGDIPPGSPDDAALRGRSPDARLARLHLRGGLLSLARAALEQMAGAGTLDTPAMADLAEARWRSGDLEGAADAARAHQASGGAEPLAALILAEDLVRTERPADARRYAEFVAAHAGGAFDQLFASEPRSSAWPPEDDGWMPQDAVSPGRWGLLVGGREVAAPTPQTWLGQPIVAPAPPAAADAALVGTALVGRGGAASQSGPSSTSAVVLSGRLAGQELDRVDRSLAAGDAGAATGRLAVLLRLDPALAPVILSAAERAATLATTSGGDLSAIHLVRGDAYRILGRENEAAEAYRLAHQALLRGPSREEPT